MTEAFASLLFFFFLTSKLKRKIKTYKPARVILHFQSPYRIETCFHPTAHSPAVCGGRRCNWSRDLSEYCRRNECYGHSLCAPFIDLRLCKKISVKSCQLLRLSVSPGEQPLVQAHRLRTLLNVRARINLSMASPVNPFDGNFILNGIFATKGCRIHLLLTKENISWEIENVPKCKWLPGCVLCCDNFTVLLSLISWVSAFYKI